VAQLSPATSFMSTALSLAVWLGLRRQVSLSSIPNSPSFPPGRATAEASICWTPATGSSYAASSPSSQSCPSTWCATGLSDVLADCFVFLYCRTEENFHSCFVPNVVLHLDSRSFGIVCKLQHSRLLAMSQSIGSVTDPHS
jgi:hypothetical protein